MLLWDFDSTFKSERDWDVNFFIIQKQPFKGMLGSYHAVDPDPKSCAIQKQNPDMIYTP
jgi:hypothetical protein